MTACGRSLSHMEMGVRMDPRDYANEVGFKCLYCRFCCVVSMCMGGTK